MGKEVERAAELRGINVVFGVDPQVSGDETIPVAPDFKAADTTVDCIIDFSHHSSTRELLEFAVSNKIPLVLATTGQTEDEKSEIYEAAKKIPLFFASNYSLGITLLTETAKKIVSTMPDADVEIIEYHHNRKADAPSGTALSIFEALKEVRSDAEANTDRCNSGKRHKNEIGISSVRMGNICGIHEILISTRYQTITLKHEAHTRAVFAEGALVAAEFIVSKNPGLYTIKNLL